MIKIVVADEVYLPIYQEGVYFSKLSGDLNREFPRTFKQILELLMTKEIVPPVSPSLKRDILSKKFTLEPEDIRILEIQRLTDKGWKIIKIEEEFDPEFHLVEKHIYTKIRFILDVNVDNPKSHWDIQLSKRRNRKK